MKRIIMYACLILVMNVGCAQHFKQAQVPGAVYKEGPVIGKMVDAGFYYGDSNYHAVCQASDGNVYYVICSHNLKSNACMFRYNPKTSDVDMVGSFNEVLGEDGSKVFPQGKVHSDFFEHKGKLYFGTHCGSYVRGGSDERGPYPGGHFMSYDLATGKFEDFGIGEPEQGMVSLTMDKVHGRLYAITWPDLKFVYYDIASDKIKRFGRKVALPGIDEVTSIQGPRSLGADPRTGNVYWHNMDVTIACYNYKKDTVETLENPKFDTPMFAIPLPPSVRINWRSIRWNEVMQKFYGVMYYSDYLISFEPITAEIEIIDRIASGPDRKSGEITYSSLAFELSADGKTVFYICRDEGVLPDSTKREDLHLVTYNIPLRRYTDHGVIKLDDGRQPRYCQGLEVGKDGNLYIVCWINYTDLTTDKGKKLYEMKTGEKPALDVEQSENLQEINLIVLKNPLAD